MSVRVILCNRKKIIYYFINMYLSKIQVLNLTLWRTFQQFNICLSFDVHNVDIIISNVNIANGALSDCKYTILENVLFGVEIF